MTFSLGPASNVIIIEIKIVVNCFVNHRASSPPDRRRRRRRQGAAKVSVGGSGSR